MYKNLGWVLGGVLVLAVIIIVLINQNAPQTVAANATVATSSENVTNNITPTAPVEQTKAAVAPVPKKVSSGAGSNQTPTNPNDANRACKWNVTLSTNIKAISQSYLKGLLTSECKQLFDINGDYKAGISLNSDSVKMQQYQNAVLACENPNLPNDFYVALGQEITTRMQGCDTLYPRSN